MATADYFTHRSPAPRARPPLSSGLGTGPGTPGSPHTPVLGRSTSSNYGSPSAYRTEDDSVIYELGSRHLRAGFAGESAPRCILHFGPEQSRRLGDFERWAVGYDEKRRKDKGPWAEEWELWKMDVRGLDLGLVEDKLERAIREIHTKIFLLDTKGRKCVLAIPSCLPHPLIEVALRALFTGMHAPTNVFLVSDPVLHTVAAGLRSALVIDIGWHETSVTALYELREVERRRTDRGGKLLSESAAAVLQDGVQDKSSKLSFAVVEDVMTRMAWCRTLSQLAKDDPANENICTMPLGTSVKNAVRLPFSQLCLPAEQTFFETKTHLDQIDDHHIPLHILAWKCLLALPFDVRAICISRIVITGGVSKMPGLKTRLLEEIEKIVKERSWDPVMSYGSATTAREKLPSQRSSSRQAREKPPETPNSVRAADINTASDLQHEPDEILEKLNRDALRREPTVKGVVRGVETMGAWAGASLMASLRVEGGVEIKRDEFFKQGIRALGDII